MPLTEENEILIHDEMTGIHTNTGFYKEKVKQTFQEILKEINVLNPVRIGDSSDARVRNLILKMEEIIKKHIPEEWSKEVKK